MRRMRRAKARLLQGTLDMLVLKALWHGSNARLRSGQADHANGDDARTVEEGSLYRALHRLAQQGWITSEWGVSANNQRARYYSPTIDGRRHLGVEEANWDRLSMALALTAIGIFGIVAYTVAERRNELGIRLALGAQRHVICRLVLAKGARLTAIAVVIGGVCAVAATPLFRRFTPAPGGSDLWLVAAVGLFVSGVALLACWIPARRAAQVDPLAALGER